MTLAYIRDYYRVPANSAGRVKYTGGKVAKIGTIVGASGPHLSIRLDGEKHAKRYHPTWEIRYLDAHDVLKGTRP